MKKAFLSIAIAVASLSLVTVSCTKAEKEVPAGEALAGSYVGDLSVTVNGSESTDTATILIEEVDENNISFTFPGTGSGMMVVPIIKIDKIPAVKATVDGVEVSKASLDSYAGTITVDGVEKTYNFTNLVILGSDDKLSFTCSLQYGKMPFAMACEFSGVSK